MSTDTQTAAQTLKNGVIPAGSDAPTAAATPAAPTPAAPTDKADPGAMTTNHRPRVRSTERLEKRAQTVLDDNKDNKSPQVVADLKRLALSVVLVRNCFSVVNTASDGVTTARAAHKPTEKQLHQAEKAIGGVLKATPGGTETWLNTEAANPGARAKKLVDALQGARFKVPQEMIQQLEDDAAAEVAARQKIADAQKAQQDAAAAYAKARQQVQAAISAVFASKRHAEVGEDDGEASGGSTP